MHTKMERPQLEIKPSLVEIVLQRHQCTGQCGVETGRSLTVTGRKVFLHWMLGLVVVPCYLLSTVTDCRHIAITQQQLVLATYHITDNVKGQKNVVKITFQFQFITLSRS